MCTSLSVAFVSVSFVFCFCFVHHICATPLLKNYDIWGDQKLSNSDGNISRNVIQPTQNRLPKVLNFFPVPVEDECVPLDSRRRGICMNTYECRIQGGASSGRCALGFGVCCVFTATCGYEVINNITYFVNPDFPDLSRDMTSCELKIRRVDPDIAQLRLDFIHFQMGQPNRRTGICDDDLFLMTGGNSKDVKICGLNSGQHMYYDVENINEPITIQMKMGKVAVARMWEVRVLQIPFTERAPAGCTQYFTGARGIIQTMNFADNGRRLADQDYNICMRQEDGMCSIAYEPCHENAFRIGAGSMNSTTIFRPPNEYLDTNANNGIADGVQGENGQDMGQEVGNQEAVVEDEAMGDPEGETMMDGAQEDGLEGSGGGTGEVAADVPLPVVEATNRQFQDVCPDRIVMPCESDELLTLDGRPEGMGLCDIAHCGDSLCPPNVRPCRIESTVLPFTIGVHFGPESREEPADDNLGMCLSYEQQPCT